MQPSGSPFFLMEVPKHTRTMVRCEESRGLNCVAALELAQPEPRRSVAWK